MERNKFILDNFHVKKKGRLCLAGLLFGSRPGKRSLGRGKRRLKDVLLTDLDFLLQVFGDGTTEHLRHIHIRTASGRRTNQKINTLVFIFRQRKYRRNRLF